MWGPNQRLPTSLSQSGQSVSRVLGLVKSCGRVSVWVGHVHTKRRQKARARPPGGPVESRNSHARRAESDRTKRKTNTNTTPHTHAYTPSQTRVYTPNPTAHPQNNNRAKKTHTRLHTQWVSRQSLQGGPPMKESNVGPQPTASTESVRSVSQSSAGSRQVLWACVSQVSQSV